MPRPLAPALTILIVLASPHARAAEAAGPAGGTVLAPAGGVAGRDAAEAAETLVEDRSWKLCEVSASLLATAPGRSIVASEKTGYLYLGETLDLESDVTVPVAQGTALVHARVRVRAAAATQAGVTYLIASDGVLRSTIGFRHPVAGQDQFRQEVLEVGDGGTRLHEIFALPDLGLRVVMVLGVRPVSGREEQTARQMLAPPVPGQARRFRIEAFLREGDRFEPVEQATLSTMDGREAGMSLTRFTSAGAEGGLPRGMPRAPAVKTIAVPGVPETSAAQMGAVTTVPADRKFQERVETLQRSLRMDPTVDLSSKLPGQRDLPATPRKISPNKRKKIQEMHERAAIREWAIEQSKKLPASEAVPEGYDREELELTLTPLRASVSSLQVEIRLRGRIRLPKEEAFTAIDATTVEQVRFGEPLELGVAELVREGEPLYDYVLRITPEH
jgi:hypothetical protein